MKLLIGLGNPGARYARNRHNVGFMTVDAIAERHGLGPWRRRFQGEAAEGRIGGEKVLLLKPQTYMNESGRAAGEAARFFKLSPADMVVFHDELDLAPGKVKVKQGGGHAGHNGLKSLTAHCGAEFWRVRIGIGHPGDKAKVTAHVLGDFAKADAEWLDPLLAAMADAAPALVSGNEAKFVSDVAQAMHDVRAPAKEPAPKREKPQPAPRAPEQEAPSAPTALGEKLRRWLTG
ncbi:aminoacyl-tRNA hydrolase [Dichotomicrobium thermohalophilum]|uniref:Peptidyl-tRNA hydrolase n=1 Tax=Dichotomicrobium thermohalophilum TaxID=933063 RepID=A0A397PE45_9HYPH|nr:aminoacyl-tRNA hydrolase [Dichotomicrobium thermohalophilum]RIA47238.1 peptidyl-tRNA hydrolase [Dichotomicrobium thermohalophilum]